MDKVTSYILFIDELISQGERLDSLEENLLKITTEAINSKTRIKYLENALQRIIHETELHSPISVAGRIAEEALHYPIL